MRSSGSILLCALVLRGALAPAAEPAASSTSYTAEELMTMDPLFAAAIQRCGFVATVGQEKDGTPKTETCAEFLKGHGRPNGMTLPPQAPEHMPTLVEQIQDVWPEMKYPSVFAAQIEQESCISLKHSKCWNTRAELKTDREMGFGLGQLTLKFKDASGAACKEETDCPKGEFCRHDGVCVATTMNMFEEMRKLDDKLSQWRWADRANAAMQIRSVILLNKRNWDMIKWDVADDVEKLAMMLSAYNGGLGHILQDRKLCEVKGRDKCDPTRWFGNIELDSVKAKVARPGYGKSFFEINREYPVHVLFTRRPKYMPLTETIAAPAPAPAPAPTAAPPAVVVLPSVKKRSRLVFPPAAALAGIKQHEVVFQLTIGADGSLTKVNTIKGDEPFVKAARDALRKDWEFTPGTRDGTPVEATFELTLLFQK